LDLNHDGRIEPNECDGEPFRDLLAAADIDRDTSLDVLADEIFAADSNKDGIVTNEEWSAAIRSGIPGRLPRPLNGHAARLIERHHVASRRVRPML
jgi:hypothetical protein